MNEIQEMYARSGYSKVETSTDAVFFIQPYGDGRFFVAAFAGKSKKPVFHYAYATREAAAKKMAEFESMRASVAARKAAAKAERTAYRHDFKVGDIVYTSGGYDETWVEFFQVVDATAKTFTVVAMTGVIVSTDQNSTTRCAGEMVAGGERHKVRPNVGGGFKIGYRYGGRWDGRPKHDSRGTR